MANKDLPKNPAIRVIFKGFVVSHIRPDTDEAWVGALDSSISTCHRPKVTIYKILLPDPPHHDGKVELSCPEVNFNKDFNLIFTPQPPPKSIQTYVVEPGPFQRLDEDNDKKDFRWFVDLDEIHPRPITFIDGKVRPKFYMNKGFFHTSLRSDGDTRIGLLKDPKPGKRFGKFALEITARVELLGTDKARLYHDGKPLTDEIKQGGPRYDIVFDCSCPANDDADDSDFDQLVYHAITGMTAEEKVKFSRKKKVERFNPEVYCMGGNGGG